jgi:hypothetical protein
MTVPSHAIPLDLVEAFRTGNDKALEPGFRALFPVLAIEAAAQLDDPSAAGRVVDRTFLRLWEQRDAITDADGLDLALRMALHESAVREKSRRAALHRFERNEGVTQKTPHATSSIDADQAWERLQRAIHQPSHAAESVASHSAEAKHRTAAHMSKGVERRSKWTIPLIVGGVVVVLAAAYGLTRLDTGPNEAEIQRALAAVDANVLNAGPGQIAAVNMADETLLKLGPGSTLRTPREFGKSLRTVSLKGTAAFTIPSSSRPFGLRANGIAISIPSGKIDVSAEDAAPIIVRVRDGQARATLGDSSWNVATGQSFVVETNKTIRAATAGELDEAFNWTEGHFLATGTVKSVVAKVNLWFSSDLGIGDASVLARPATASGSIDSLMATIRSLEKSAKVQMQWTKGKMLLFPARQ